MVLRRQNRNGEWIPAIPLPLFILGRKQCKFRYPENSCNKGFWTMNGYKGHYALVHIVGHDYE